MAELTDSFETDDLPELTQRVRILAGSIVMDSHRADDVAQDVALHELQRPRDGAGAPRSRGWFVRTIRNLAQKQVRSATRRRSRETRVARSELVGSAADAVQHAETLQHVVAAALALEEPYRTTILLRFLQDVSVAEVARIMQVPASTVRVRTKRAIERLRQSLRRSLGSAYALLLLRFAEPAAPSIPTGSAEPSSIPTTLTDGARMKPLIWLTATTAGVLGVVLASGPWNSADIAPASLRSSSAPRLAHARSADVGTDPARIALRSTQGSPGPAGATVAMHPPLTGRVVDPTGQSIEGATVQIFDQQITLSDAMHSGASCAPPLAVTTGPDGRFSTSARHPFAHWGLAVDAPGFATTATYFRCENEDEPIVLYPATTLIGTVTDAATGAPLAGTTVRVLDVAYASGRVALSRAVTTDDTGRYRLSEVAALTRLRVEYAKPGAAPWLVTLDLDATAENTHDVALSTAHAEVLAVDATTLGPIAGARVYRSGFEIEFLGTTDAQGRFRFEVPHVADATTGWPNERKPSVRIERTGYSATQRRIPQIDSGSVAELEMRLLAAGAITGTVRDLDGAPVAGARVGWQELALTFVEPAAFAVVALDSREAETDAAGRFSLPHVLTGDHAIHGMLRIEAGDEVAWIDDALPSASERVCDFDVVLGAGSCISGSTSAGAAAAASWVSIESCDGGSLKRSIASTPAGEFAFFGVPDGRYRITARSADGATMQSAPVEVTVDAADVAQVSVEFASEVATITGRALHDDGSALEGWDVLAFAAGEVDTDPGDPIDTPESFATDDSESGGGLATIIAATATVRADGSFTIHVKPNIRQRYVLGVYKGAFGAVVRNVRQGMTGVELRMPKLAPVRVRMTRAADGEPVARAGIRWTHPASNRQVTLAWRRAWDTNAGVLSLLLPVGTVQLSLRDAASGATTTREILVPTDGIADPVTVSL